MCLLPTHPISVTQLSHRGLSVNFNYNGCKIVDTFAKIMTTAINWSHIYKLDSQKKNFFTKTLNNLQYYDNSGWAI